MKDLKRINDLLELEDEENLTPFQIVDNYRRMSEYLHTFRDKFIDAYWSKNDKVYELLHEVDRTLFNHSGEDE